MNQELDEHMELNGNKVFKNNEISEEQIEECIQSMINNLNGLVKEVQPILLPKIVFEILLSYATIGTIQVCPDFQLALEFIQKCIKNGIEKFQQVSEERREKSKENE